MARSKRFAAKRLAALYMTLDDYRGIVRRILWPSDAETLEQFEAGELSSAA
jgi:hypothetical protein